MLPLAHTSLFPKQHLDWFSQCTAQACANMHTDIQTMLHAMCRKVLHLRTVYGRFGLKRCLKKCKFIQHLKVATQNLLHKILVNLRNLGSGRVPGRYCNTAVLSNASELQELNWPGPVPAASCAWPASSLKRLPCTSQWSGIVTAVEILSDFLVVVSLLLDGWSELQQNEDVYIIKVNLYCALQLHSYSCYTQLCGVQYCCSHPVLFICLSVTCGIVFKQLM